MGLVMSQKTRVRLAFWLYYFIAVSWAAEAFVRSPFIASFSGLVTARVLGAVEVPVVVPWADTVRVFVADSIPNGAVAVALGRVVILSDAVRDDERVLLHEVVHVRQYERWLSFGFSMLYAYHVFRLLFAYGGIMSYAHYAHPFEVEAYRAQFGAWGEPQIRFAARD
jgi:hypothetical protein